MYSNPPKYGAAIAKTVLKDEKLYNLWLEDIKTMADRIAFMRTSLKEEILKAGS